MPIWCRLMKACELLLDLTHSDRTTPQITGIVLVYNKKANL